MGDGERLYRVGDEDYAARLPRRAGGDAGGQGVFPGADRKNLYPIYYRLDTAKRPETRAKRLAQILAQLDPGERFD